MGRNDIIQVEEKSFEPLTLVLDVLRNWWVILLGALGAAMLTAVILSYRYEPVYSATATFVVTLKNNANAGNVWSKSYEMAETMRLILESSSMNRIICEELEVDHVDAKITTETLGSTNLLALKVTADTSKAAMDVIKVVMDNYDKVSFYATGITAMEVLEYPTVPTAPSNSNNVKRPALKVFLAAGAALTFLFGLFSYLNDTIKMESDVEKKLDASCLGQIPYERKNKTAREWFRRNKKALLINNPITGFPFVEAYRKLAVKVDHRMKKHNLKALVVTSVAENEGKSTMAANLAIALATQSRKVILIEGDLRRPAQFLLFGKMPEEKQEVGEFLKGNSELKDIMIKSEIPNLYVLLGRNCYASSTEMVQGNKMDDLLEQCRKIADYVIIDSPPIGLIGDAEVLASKAGGVLVVSRQNYLHAEDINDALDGFRARKAVVLGVVLNHVRTFASVVEGTTYGKYGKYAEVYGDKGNR